MARGYQEASMGLWRPQLTNATRQPWPLLPFQPRPPSCNAPAPLAWFS